MTIELIYVTWPNRLSRIHWCEMASAIREAGLTKTLEQIGFPVSESIIEATGDDAAEIRAAFELAAQTGALVKATHNTGSLSVIICGSCSVAALGALCGLGGEDTGVLWMDSHADLNTPETTLSGLFDGMAASIVIGEAWQAMALDIAGLTPASRRNLCLYGARALDAAERFFIDDEAIPVVSDADGAVSALQHCGQAYIHMDMDVHNAAHFRANIYAASGGPSPDDVRQHLSQIGAALPVAALSVTGLDPESAAREAIECAIGYIAAFCAAWREAQP